MVILKSILNNNNWVKKCLMNDTRLRQNVWLVERCKTMTHKFLKTKQTKYNNGYFCSL